MIQRILFNFGIAMDAVFTNKLRTLLTGLGILFGVSAVIAMLAIGSGAKQELLAQLKLVGSNNILIKPMEQEEEESNEVDGQEKKRPFSPGLSLEDVTNIEKVVPSVELASPEIILPVTVVRNGKLKKAKCVGITNAFFEINNFKLSKGNLFHEVHLENGKPVCIIGKSVQNQFFSGEDPIGQKIKCGNTWLTIIGVLEQRIASKKSLSNLGIRDFNSDIYVPAKTTLLRFKNRSLLTSKNLKSRGGGGFVVISGDDNKSSGPVANYHQLDRLVVRVSESKYLQSTADVIARILKRRHWDVLDFEVSVPELLLKQEQEAQNLFNLVLGGIAGISLLIGGIGIMNIMLASVLERIKEIGLRRSLGATQGDIVQQFLFEAIFISMVGGILGVILGFTSAELIRSVFNIPTLVTWWSVALSFGVAALTGLVFGIFPAEKASRLDPIVALRNE